MNDDIEGKSLSELRAFRVSLADTRSKLENCCQLGRTPFGGSQNEIEREYDNRIRAVSTEIARLERNEREAEEKAKRETLQSAIIALTLYQCLIDAMRASGQHKLADTHAWNLPELIEELRQMKEGLVNE